MGVITHVLNFDPNFLGHLSSIEGRYSPKLIVAVAAIAGVYL